MFSKNDDNDEWREDADNAPANGGGKSKRDGNKFAMNGKPCSATYPLTGLAGNRKEVLGSSTCPICHVRLDLHGEKDETKAEIEDVGLSAIIAQQQVLHTFPHLLVRNRYRQARQQQTPISSVKFAYGEMIKHATLTAKEKLLLDIALTATNQRQLAASLSMKPDELTNALNSILKLFMETTTFPHQTAIEPVQAYNWLWTEQKGEEWQQTWGNIITKATWTATLPQFDDGARGERFLQKGIDEVTGGETHLQVFNSPDGSLRADATPLEPAVLAIQQRLDNAERRAAQQEAELRKLKVVEKGRNSNKWQPNWRHQQQQSNQQQNQQKLVAQLKETGMTEQAARRLAGKVHYSDFE